MGFSDDLRAEADGIWEAQHAHPTVTGIGDGSLPLDRFRSWVTQDWIFLVDYGRALAYGAARAPDLETMRRLAELAHETLGTEMALHRAFCAELGIAGDELDRARARPETVAYTNFLVRTAAAGSFAELVAALLPCMWGFSEIGARLAARGRPDQPQYAAWIDMYASPEFGALAAWCRELCDRVADGAGDDERAAMRRAFVASSEFELAFWATAAA